MFGTKYDILKVLGELGAIIDGSDKFDMANEVYRHRKKGICRIIYVCARLVVRESENRGWKKRHFQNGIRLHGNFTSSQ
jgi:hypothetical protein